MKYLNMKLALIAVLIGLVSFGITPKNSGTDLKIEKLLKSIDPVEINYDDLPPFVKEFMYKGYEVKPEDVRKIIKIKDGAFFVKLKRSVNVFEINTQLEMHHAKLDFFSVKSDLLGQRQATKKVQKVKQKRSRDIRLTRRPTAAPEIAWTAIPRNVREYLIKQMAASESQIYKAYDQGNNTYKIILKKAYDEFVIFEAHPERIAFEDSVTDLLDD